MRSGLEFAVDAILTSFTIGWDALDVGFYSNRLLEKQSHRVGNCGTDVILQLLHSPLSLYLSRSSLLKKSTLPRFFFRNAVNLDTRAEISDKWFCTFIYS
jgi:hypothetical protein